MLGHPAGAGSSGDLARRGRPGIRGRVRAEERALIEDYPERAGLHVPRRPLPRRADVPGRPRAGPEGHRRAGRAGRPGVAAGAQRRRPGHRPGLSGDWAACAEAFGSDRYENRIGVSARADRLADLTARLACVRAAGHRLVRGADLHRHRGRRRRTSAGPGGPAGLRGAGRANRPVPAGGGAAARHRAEGGGAVRLTVLGGCGAGPRRAWRAAATWSSTTGSGC